MSPSPYTRNPIDITIRAIYDKQKQMPNLDKQLTIYMTLEWYTTLREAALQMGRSIKIWNELQQYTLMDYPIYIVTNRRINRLTVHPNFVLAEV